MANSPTKRTWTCYFCGEGTDVAWSIYKRIPDTQALGEYLGKACKRCYDTYTRAGFLTEEGEEALRRSSHGH
jgi:hypothetical protein